MKTMIDIQGLCRDYGHFKLDNVSLSVPGGSIMGLIGENGAGKSTTLKCLLGLVRPDSGQIRILGQPLDSAEIREQIGVVFDENRFAESLTAAQVGKMMPFLYKNWDAKLYDRFLDKYGLSPKLLIREYSRGMKMKLAITAALSHQPRVLVLDEATSGLDPVVREEILDEFLEFIQDENHAILISSHITSDLEKVADYITYIHKGKTILQGEKDELLSQYGRLACAPEQLAAIDRKLLVVKRSSQFGVEALVNNRAEVRRRYPNLTVDPITLDEIMVLTTKGDAI